MNFSNKYFDRFGYSGIIIPDEIPENLGLSVIIPCFNEPSLQFTINSLLSVNKPNYNTEVIVVINAPHNATAEQIKQNSKTIDYLNTVINKDWIFVRKIIQPTLTKKLSGVGSARKAGMDEAIRRFGIANNPKGIIVSLDADCIVAKDYLTDIECFFKQNKKALGCSLGFKHIYDNQNTTPQQINAISQYELYLRYYYHSLKFIGFPNYFYAIGSAFAVTALAYISQGGMNRRQAGEDFYFVQKLIQAGEFGHIKNTLVFPSSRESDRVPFGTGTVVRDLKNSSTGYLTYSPESFLLLKLFFKNITNQWFTKDYDINVVLANIDINNLLKNFLQAENYNKNIAEIIQNSANFKNFKNRFFKWFDGLKILKFLNHSNEIYFGKKSIEDAAKHLLKELNYQTRITDYSAEDLLEIYRELDKN